MQIEDYAYQLGRHWRIGQTEANNGVLLLVAPNERRVRIEVGYGLEGILTDAFSSRIINEQIVPRFRENDYPGGIEVGTAALVSQLAAPPEQAEQRALEAERARQRARPRGGDRGGGGDGFGLHRHPDHLRHSDSRSRWSERPGGRRRRPRLALGTGL